MVRAMLAVALLTVMAVPAEACRVPNDPAAARLQKQRQHQESAAAADIIVEGRMYKQAAECLPSHHCGDWIQAVHVTKGTPAEYFLIDPDQILLVCSREYVKPGKLGRFHLQATGNGMYLILDDIR